MILRLSTIIAATATSGAVAMGHVDWDTDGSGGLNPDEFAAGFAPMRTHAAFDRDGSGQLDEAEWRPLSEVGEYVNMDLNGDGGVDAYEYRALLFNRYDRDGSGVLAGPEMDMIEGDLAPGGMLAP
ncbi:hypothetical protein ACK8OR_05235 [Jannaschia sp. KMU-145]|uniref:hypothetical protein n=1 Tax=Jannaschia halovivens TaxID=3388667 RepID=UPI00396B37F7